MFKRISVAISVVGILLAVNLVFRQRRPLPEAPPLSEPAAAPYAASIGARGIVESVEENVRIAPAQAGLVAAVPVKVGDAVRAGDVLFEQDVRDAEALVSVQDANVAAIRSSILESEVNLADRQSQWNRMEQLGKNRVVSLDEKERTLFALRAATTRLDSRKSDLVAAEALRHRAVVQRELLSVRAPRDGTVLQINVRAGEYAMPTGVEPAVLLGRVDAFQLRADVDEDNASQVKAGCAAVAFIKGARHDAIPLRFIRIEPYILPKRSLSGESAERVDTRVLQVIFRFDATSVPVYVGQQMDVFLDAK